MPRLTSHRHTAESSAKHRRDLRDKKFTPAPGGPDMSLQEAFDRVLTLCDDAKFGISGPELERDQQAIDLVRSIAVGSHSYKVTT